MFDLDRFKGINDELGHLGGDFTLRELSACVKGSIRKEELFARYGGEEFVIVLPETPRDAGLTVAERLRGLVERHLFQYEGKAYPVTVSLGLAATNGEDALTPHDLIRQADEKLYQAKNAGRNRVVA
jgi:two-component system cell cycle response regulator